LSASIWRVIWQTLRLQGFTGAVRVLPIVWTIIGSVKGFAAYHAAERARMSRADASGIDIEEAALSLAELEEYRKLGAWLRNRLHKLGPTFIKIGQTLSTRADLLPLPAMLELSSLQEGADPFPDGVARQIIKRELGAEPEKLFARFDSTPMAAASLSQAYRAVLPDGRDVVVKVQRPDLPTIITADIQVLEAVSGEVMRYPSLCRHTDWPGVVREFSRTIFEEIDYIKEGRNADRFRHNFRNDQRIHIPRIVWKLTGRRVLTIEYVPGVKVTDLASIEALGVSPEEVTRSGAIFYLKQLLEDGFFHADPHPGNLRIMPDGRVGIFDFGMVGRLAPDLRDQLANALLNVIKRDYTGLVADFVAMRFLPHHVEREGLARELAPIVERRFAEGLSRVRFRKVLLDFSDVVWRYPFSLPSDFTYIMRALLTLEGVALTMYPPFNFMECAVPYAQKLVIRREGDSLRRALLKEVFASGRFNAGAAINLFKAAARMPSLSG